MCGEWGVSRLLISGQGVWGKEGGSPQSPLGSLWPHLSALVPA